MFAHDSILLNVIIFIIRSHQANPRAVDMCAVPDIELL